MIVTDLKKLKQVCKDISLFEAGPIIQKLDHALRNSENPGIGLAANQIGIDAKVCIIRTQTSFIDLVNPVIVKQYDLREFYNEGCLSFPGRWIVTKRFNEIFIKDLLHPFGIICTGIEGVAVQHEIDHLYGKTMFDYEIQIPGPNLRCWCGQGKYKKCHSGKIISS